MSNYLLINGSNVSHLVKSMKVGYETLVADSSGRNANGDTVIDVINKKAKIYVTFIPMDKSNMSMLLSAIQDYVIDVQYRDPKTNSNKTITCYTGTPEPDYYCIIGDKVMYKEMSLNFIQL